MANHIKVLVFPVKDFDTGKKFFSTFLGTEPYADSEYYVGYKIGDIEIGLAHDTVGPIAYVDTDDIKAALAAMAEAGAEVTQPPQDVAAGLLIARIKDADGSVVGFRQHP